MFGRIPPPLFALTTHRLPRLAAALCITGVAIVVIGVLAARDIGAPVSVTVHWATYYGLTTVAYAALPFIRRGDILMVAGWLVLAGGVAPCALGQEISAPHMFADMIGVVTAAGPIYIARLRQLAQGDIRSERRRQGDRES